jgi:hypothetical protein
MNTEFSKGLSNSIVWVVSQFELHFRLAINPPKAKATKSPIIIQNESHGGDAAIIST